MQSLEEQKCQLEKELDFLKDQIKTADEKKELELQVLIYISSYTFIKYYFQFVLLVII